jgi:hypothetical protein
MLKIPNDKHQISNKSQIPITNDRKLENIDSTISSAI